VETQCGRKPLAASHLNLLLNKKILLQYFCTGAILYQYAGFYLQRATTPIDLVLANPFTSTQAATFYNAPNFSTAIGRELPPP